MKKILVALLTLISFQSLAEPLHCGTIKSVYTWTNGNDTYGVWVALDSQVNRCTQYFIGHDRNNKDLAYSSILAAQMANKRVCFQIHGPTADISTRCSINYVRVDK